MGRGRSKRLPLGLQGFCARSGVCKQNRKTKALMDMHGAAGEQNEFHLPSPVNGTVSLVSISVGHLISKGLFDDCKLKRGNVQGSENILAINSFRVFNVFLVS